MRIAIISDVHSNLEALKSVFNDIEEHGVDRVFCLGDIVGYGPSPKECLDLTRENAEIIIKGNHEEAVCDPHIWKDFMKDYTFRSIEYSISKLDSSDIEFLRGLPTISVIEDLNIALAHGTYKPPHNTGYIYKITDAISDIDNMPVNACLIGHTHMPAIFYNHDDIFSEYTDGQLTLKGGWKYSINVGSVGQPRDSKTKAGYGILDIGRKNTRYTLRRVKYNVMSTVESMKEAGIDKFLWQRLIDGT